SPRSAENHAEPVGPVAFPENHLARSKAVFRQIRRQSFDVGERHRTKVRDLSEEFDVVEVHPRLLSCFTTYNTRRPQERQIVRLRSRNAQVARRYRSIDEECTTDGARLDRLGDPASADARRSRWRDRGTRRTAAGGVLKCRRDKDGSQPPPAPLP